MNIKFILLISVVGVFMVVIYQTSLHHECSSGEVIPVFSPDDSEEIVQLIKNAKYEIKLEVYEFSYKNLANLLIESRNRGLEVKVILEHSVYQNTNMFDYLLNSGVDVSWAPKKFFNTHSKFAIIDDSVVLVGSTNWSKNAFKNNREASVIIYSQKVASDFEKIFDSDLG